MKRSLEIEHALPAAVVGEIHPGIYTQVWLPKKTGKKAASHVGAFLWEARERLGDGRNPETPPNVRRFDKTQGPEFTEGRVSQANTPTEGEWIQNRVTLNENSDN